MVPSSPCLERLSAVLADFGRYAFSAIKEVPVLFVATSGRGRNDRSGFQMLVDCFGHLRIPRLRHPPLRVGLRGCGHCFSSRGSLESEQKRRQQPRGAPRFEQERDFLKHAKLPYDTPEILFCHSEAPTSRIQILHRSRLFDLPGSSLQAASLRGKARMPASECEVRDR